MSQIFEWARRIKMELELYDRQDLELADARMGLPEGERDQDREREEDGAIDTNRECRLARMFEKGLQAYDEAKHGRKPVVIGRTQAVKKLLKQKQSPGAHTPDRKPGVRE